MEDHKKEVDLFYISDRANQTFNRFVLELWKVLRFLRKTWYILLIFVLAGAGYGYYLHSQKPMPKEVRTMIRVNFDAVDYVYSVVENLNENFMEKGVVLSEDRALNAELKKIAALELEPVIDLKEVLDYYDQDDRRLENILRNGEFTFEEDDEEIPEITATFRTDYVYHQLTVIAHGGATQKTIDAVVRFMNERPLMEEVKTTATQGLRDRIAGTRETIEQIDKVMEKYQIEDEAELARGSNLFVVDNFDISRVFQTKADLLRELENLNRDFVYAKDVVVNVSQSQFYDRHGFIKNRIVYYALLSFLLYLFLGFIRYVYLGVKRVALETEQNLS